MKTHDFLSEYALIVRQQHPGYGRESDRVRNSETFCWRIAHDMPEDAAALALDIERNLADCSEEHGLPPGALRRIVGMLRANCEHVWWHPVILKHSTSPIECRKCGADGSHILKATT